MIGFKVEILENKFIQIPKEIVKKLELDEKDWDRVILRKIHSRYNKITLMENKIPMMDIESNVKLYRDYKIDLKPYDDIKFEKYAYLKNIGDNITISPTQYDDIYFKQNIDSSNRIIIREEIKEVLGVNNHVYLCIENGNLEKDKSENNILLEIDDSNKINLPKEIVEKYAKDGAISLKYNNKSNTCSFTTDTVYEVNGLFDGTHSNWIRCF